MKNWRRWLRLRRPTLGGLVRASLVCFLGLLVLASQAVAYYQEPGLNGIASRLAGGKVKIICHTPKEQEHNIIFSFYGAEAYVKYKVIGGIKVSEPVAHFRDVHCKNLIAGMRGDLSGIEFHGFVWSVLAITHESGHMRNGPVSFSEARTQCWAMQHYQSTLNMLGIRDPAFRDEVTRHLLWIHLNELPPAYQLPTCDLPEVPPPPTK